MQFHFSYNKKKTIQALRFHFMSDKLFRLLFITVNVFAILAAVLFYTKLIRPQFFLFTSFMWAIIWVTIWYIMPYSIYKKSKTFRFEIIVLFDANTITIAANTSQVTYKWRDFSKYLESTYFFHIYFDNRSFFLLSKEAMSGEICNQMRTLLRSKTVA